MSDTYLTRKGYEKLYQDLDRLKKMRSQLSMEIGEAAEKGDLRENAEYTAAKEKQADTLRRISEVETKLNRAKLIEEMNIKTDEIRIGSQVTIQDKSDSETYTYFLVGADESDPAEGKISVYSPLAQALLGHKVGDQVEAQLPAGKSVYKIKKIDR